MVKLTLRQREILQEIQRFMDDEGYPPSIRDLAQKFAMASSSMLDHVRALERKGVIRRRKGKSRGIELADSLSKPKPVAIPILGRVAAGPPILAEENIEGTVLLDPTLAGGNELFALRIKGDSMMGAGFFDNDLCIVQMAGSAENGDIVVAMLDAEATVKRLKKTEDTVQLIPENPDYEPITITAKDTDFRILGKVIALYRSL
jgi:repressor LexA